jgi:hypothetical protein
MPRTVDDWNAAAEDARTALNERRREFPIPKMMSVIDELSIVGSAAKTDMIGKHGHADFIATTLGHVTVAVHGPGNVPTSGGWYHLTRNPDTYNLHPEFAAAWKKMRRL